VTCSGSRAANGSEHPNYRRGALSALVVTGPAGSGKTTVGRAVAARLGWAFCEGDDLHPPANIAAMRAGRPLTDADRAPWLAAVAAQLEAWRDAGVDGVLTCSALKRAYREQLRGPGVRFVLLAVDPATLADRLAHRRGHFLAPTLLESQLAAFEPPGPDEDVRIVDGTAPDVVATVAAYASGAAASNHDTNPV
jgi:gluconokinase